MSINPFIYDLRALKFRCIQAYFHFQLEEAQKETDKGKGKVCSLNYDKVKDCLIDIKSRIENNKNTYEDIKNYAKINPIIALYYNVIGKIVKKYFSLNNGWIPSFLTLEVLRIFTEKGYKDFADIDFLDLQGEFQMFKDKEKGLLSKHYECAAEIVKSIENKKAFRRKRK
jgi:hypothetical protein